MIPILVIAAATLLFSAAFTRYLASFRAASVMDEPNARSLHHVSTPRTGGVAIFLSLSIGTVAAVVAARSGWVDGLLGAAVRDLLRHDFETVFLSTLLLVGVSFFDDIRDLSPIVRFLAQVVAAAFLVFGANFTIYTFYLPGIGSFYLGTSAYPLTLLFVVWMTNLYNFMDGMDGLAGGMAVIGFSVMGFLALRSGGLGIGLVAVLVAAASAGFLIYNYPPARIFMGDVGAAPLGFLAASLGVKANRDRVLGLWITIILFSPFVVDATYVLLKRIIRGARFWEAHREHWYQRLVLSGWSHKRTLWLEYALMACSAAITVYYRRIDEFSRGLVLTLLASAYVLFGLGVWFVIRRRTSHATGAANATPAEAGRVSN